VNPRNYIRQNRQLFLSFGVCILFALTLVIPAYAAEKPSEMSPQAKPVTHDPKVFSPDPSYEEKKYDAPGQIDIYGGNLASMKSVQSWNSVAPYILKVHLRRA